MNKINSQTDTSRLFNSSHTPIIKGLKFSYWKAMGLTEKRNHVTHAVRNYDLANTLRSLEQRRIETVKINADRPEKNISGVNQLWQDINLFRGEQYELKLQLETLEYKFDHTSPLARLCNHLDDTLQTLDDKLIQIRTRGQNKNFDRSTIENNQLLCVLETLESVPLLPNEILINSLSMKDILTLGITDVSKITNAINDDAKEAAYRSQREQNCRKRERTQQDNKRRVTDRHYENKKDSIKEDTKHRAQDEQILQWRRYT